MYKPPPPAREWRPSTNNTISIPAARKESIYKIDTRQPINPSLSLERVSEYDTPAVIHPVWRVYRGSALEPVLFWQLAWTLVVVNSPAFRIWEHQEVPSSRSKLRHSSVFPQWEAISSAIFTALDGGARARVGTLTASWKQCK